MPDNDDKSLVWPARGCRWCQHLLDQKKRCRPPPAAPPAWCCPEWTRPEIYSYYEI